MKLFLKSMIPSLTRARLWVPVYLTCLLPKYALSVGVPSMKWLQSYDPDGVMAIGGELA